MVTHKKLNQTFYLIVERLRKGSNDIQAFIAEMVDAGADEDTARIMVNRAVEQIAQEKKEGTRG
jgi:hypothetical protein